MKLIYFIDLITRDASVMHTTHEHLYVEFENVI